MVHRCWKMRWSHAALLLLIVWSLSGVVSGQQICVVTAAKAFDHEAQSIAVVKSPESRSQFVLFASRLRVNTDGAPTSYHPFDLRGRRLAINNIANGVSITDSKSRRKLNYERTIEVFGQFRDADWTPPKGYEVHWQNVLAAANDGKKKVPCIFKAGKDAGYFGSLTSPKNGVSKEKAGECDAGNQLDEREIPALVIAGGNNALKAYGAKIGDLIFAFNPSSGVGKAAVIGDVGAPDNLGEGSVALNMALLRVRKQPSNYSEAKSLDSGEQIILVAVMPDTTLYKRELPYTDQNISSRVNSWIVEHGYRSAADLSALMTACANRLP
jgi:hypothetical protein